MKADSRIERITNWMVGIACMATAVGFVVNVADCLRKPPPRETYSINISIGPISIPSLRDQYGYDPTCWATITRTDRLTVDCEKPWDYVNDEEYPGTTQVFDAIRPGLFDAMERHARPMRSMAVKHSFIDHWGYELWNAVVVGQARGQWVENGRTLLHDCKVPIEVIPDLGIGIEFRSASNAESEIAAIASCDDVFTQRWKTRQRALAARLRDAAGFEEGEGPLVL